MTEPEPTSGGTNSGNSATPVSRENASSRAGSGKHAATATAVRPTGKRQLTGVSTASAEDLEGKRVAKQTAAKDEKPGKGPAAFPGEVVSEMKKVIWPTARQMVTYTLVVFSFLIVMTALVAGIDYLVGLGVEAALVP